jgi:hypothetical protein
MDKKLNIFQFLCNFKEVCASSATAQSHCIFVNRAEQKTSIGSFALCHFTKIAMDHWPYKSPTGKV